MAGEDGAGASGAQHHLRHVLQVWGDRGGIRKEHLGEKYGKTGFPCAGCAGTGVGADSGVAVIRRLGFGIVAVAVHQQNGPVSVGTPRPCCLGWGGRWGGEAGLGVSVSISPPAPSHGAPGVSPRSLHTLSSSVRLTAPLRLVSVSSEISVGRQRCWLGRLSPPAPRFWGVPTLSPLTHAGEVQHGSAHGHPTGLPEIRNPDLQQDSGCSPASERGPDPATTRRHPPSRRPRPC